MIALPSNVRVWLACGHTDMWRGFDGLASQVRQHLGHDPFDGQFFVFRGKRGDLIKIFIVGRPGAVPLCQAARERPLRLAAGKRGGGVADAGATVDAAGRHRLADAGAHLAPGAGELKKICALRKKRLGATRIGIG